MSPLILSALFMGATIGLCVAAMLCALVWSEQPVRTASPLMRIAFGLTVCAGGTMLAGLSMI
jgi:hypothetical protein